MSDYFLHAECGYTFDQDGTIAALTRNEVRRLWKGLALWNEEVESHDESAGKTKTAAQERRKATAADKRRFNELAQESNEKRN